MKLLDVLSYYFYVNIKNEEGIVQPAKLLMECREEEFTRKNAKSWFFKNHYLVGLEIEQVRSISQNENHFTMPNGEVYRVL